MPLVLSSGYMYRYPSAVRFVRTVFNMADHQYTARRHVNEKTLFDDMGSGIDVNLKMGSPGDYLLRKSNELMKKATLHRLVRREQAQVGS